MKFPIIIIVLLLSLSACQLDGQNQDIFSGTFMDQQQGIGMVLEEAQDGYRGYMVFAGYKFPVYAQRKGNYLNGQMSNNNGGTMPFEASAGSNELIVKIMGQEGRLQRVDMNEIYQNAGVQAQSYNDYSASYPQNNSSGYNQAYSSGYNQNQNQNYSSGYSQTQQSYSNSGSQYANLRQRIAGSKLYRMNKGSILSGSSNYSYSEISFCSNGYFSNNTESTVGVQGGNYDYNTGQYDAYAGAASSGNYGGRWEITNVQGRPSLVLYHNGGYTWTFALQNVQNGSWNEGRTKYAMEWGKGNCR